MNRTIVVPARPDVPPHPPIYFIRHGETDWNKVGRLQGQQNIPLNELGRKQAADVAGHLRDIIGEKTRTLPWFVSPLGRVQETAAIARQTLGLTMDGVNIEPRLIEIGFGRWEGLTWKEVKSRDPKGADQRRANKWECVPPGGESYRMLLERILPLLDDLLTEECVVVAHGGIARAFLVGLTGMAGIDATTVDIWQGRVLVFEQGGAYWVP